MERLSRRGDRFHPDLSERHVLYDFREKSLRDNSNQPIVFAIKVGDGTERFDINDDDDLARIYFRTGTQHRSNQ